MINLPQVIGFDMDGTIVKSNQIIDSAMVNKLNGLAKKHIVIVISGASYEHMYQQLLLNNHDQGLQEFYLMPVNGGMCFQVIKGQPNLLWHEKMTESSAEFIKKDLQRVLKIQPFSSIVPTGKQIQFRDQSSINIKLIGDQAKYEDKLAFDPDHKIRKEFVKHLSIPTDIYTIKIAGTSTIDITLKHVDKAQSLDRLLKTLNVNQKDFVYFGDATYPGGNDEMVALAGYQVITVKDWQDTLSKIT